ncbi:hypothetical protein M406DRAFT_342819 [Cryphonectria parasitica EP155]|uniref:Uncharacterized protein n=1 Tax=Cryphonectria parasitica (strain ATCC 38755 / EP155) TaxID=660469 RepID=A0A9P4XTX6_CRYP1|nr:uncharacterized protein M406DRAFT_342819 [Cryphonectria parasitica EP155]KAF3760605.1 hypothetical protein M406DRAFT_342819 [Cryphonectria parasitica EP155]
MSSPYRPTRPSPLSSSPIRASTSPPPPLTPCDPNARRETQSSPICSPTPTPASLFGGGSASSSSNSKFALRPSRPNPVTQKREAAQESRRKLFLKNVRQRAEDQRWQRRGGEQELLKLEWFSLNAELRQAKNADLDGTIFESDIEDAARLREEATRKPRALSTISESESSGMGRRSDQQPNVDDMMVDMFEQDEQAELEALLASMPERQSARNWESPGSPHWLDEVDDVDDDDDDDYDAVFMDYLSQEGVQQQQQQQHGQNQSLDSAASGHMDLS